MDELEDHPMKTVDIRPVFASIALALLTACGGDPTAVITTAAMEAQGPAPVADCEADGGCARPRIVDGLAEQYRAGAIEQQAPPADPAPANQHAALDAVATAAAPAAAG